jgi:hypothetical protein
MNTFKGFIVSVFLAVTVSFSTSVFAAEDNAVAAGAMAQPPNNSNSTHAFGPVSLSISFDTAPYEAVLSRIESQIDHYLDQSSEFLSVTSEAAAKSAQRSADTASYVSYVSGLGLTVYAFNQMQQDLIEGEDTYIQNHAGKFALGVSMIALSFVIDHTALKHQLDNED